MASNVLSFVLLGLAPLLFLVALAVRQGGQARALNLVDYSKVSNPDALNRWAGNRLLTLPVVSAALGLVALKRPELAFALFFVLVVAVVGVTAWVAAGLSRFQRH
jgi:hypothetical protein